MNNNYYNFFDRQPIEIYENSHQLRLDYFVEDFKLKQLNNLRIGDFGCGYGMLYNRLPKDQNNTFYGWDGYDNKTASEVCEYFVTNLDSKFAEIFLEKNAPIDIAFCLETIEHVTNPYNLLFEIKQILKPGGILYVTIPHSSITHNTIYPGLIYPPENFDTFLRQMAFEIMDRRIHQAAFVQVVYTLRNLGWDYSKMLWPKPEEKFKNIPPHIFVNI